MTMGCWSALTAARWISVLGLMMMGGDTLNAASVKCERRNIEMMSWCVTDGIQGVATSTPLTTINRMHWSVSIDFKTQLISIIERHPGATNAMLREQTGINDRVRINFSLTEMESMGFIVKEETISRGHRCFKYFINPDNTAMDYAIKKYLEDNHGAKSRDISEAIGVSYTILKARMRYLSSTGHVGREMLPGGAWKYYWQEIIPFGMSRDRMMFERLLAGARRSCGR